jgi:hydroxypyruvate reductase
MIEQRDSLEETVAHHVALQCIEAGIEAADPYRLVDQAVDVTDGTLQFGDAIYDLSDYSEVYVIGGGKAAGKTAAGVEKELSDRLTRGAIVTREAEPIGIETFEASHPVPDENGVRGAERVLELASRADEGTLVIAVITGGASALLPAPADGISLSDLQAVTAELLSSGATIHEINTVRKHVSAIKGGQLAREAAPATVVGFVFSDVVGDDLDSIASGPLVPDPSTYEDAMRVVETYDLSVPDSVTEHLRAGTMGDIPETPDRDEGFFDRITVDVIANSDTALRAASKTAERNGYTPLVLSSRVRGEASEVAKTHVAIAEEVVSTGRPVTSPAVLLSGGETTVTIQGGGRGGPNQEFALSAGIELDESRIVVASVDTDGIDGNSDAAGGIVDHRTVTSAAAARSALANSDSGSVLAESGRLIHTGPTGTNVNDLRVVVVDERSDE